MSVGLICGGREARHSVMRLGAPNNDRVGIRGRPGNGLFAPPSWRVTANTGTSIGALQARAYERLGLCAPEAR